MAGAAGPGTGPGAAGGDGDDSLYPIAVLIDELRNEDVQVLESGRVEWVGSVGHLVGVGEGRRRGGAGPGLEGPSLAETGGGGRERPMLGPPLPGISLAPLLRTPGCWESRLRAWAHFPGGAAGSPLPVVPVEERVGRWRRRGAARGPGKRRGVNAVFSAGKLAGPVG